MPSSWEDLAPHELILRVASVRTDCLPSKLRKALSAKILELVTSENGDDAQEHRKWLAAQQDLKPSVPNGCQRIAFLCCGAIKAEEDSGVIEGLCALLCNCLAASHSPRLLQTCQSKLPSDKTAGVFSTFQTNGSFAAMSLADAPDWNTFVKFAFGDELASVEDIQICSQSFQSMDQSAWDDVVGPAVLKKVKAKPESVIATVEELIKHIPATALASSKLFPDLTETMLKFIKSPKDVLRSMACECLNHMSMLAVSAGDSKTTSAALDVIVNGLVEVKGLASAQQRLSLYIVCNGIAKAVDHQPSFSKKAISAGATMISKTLSKETKASKHTKTVGIEALVRWMVMCKRCSSDSQGYIDCLAYVRKPFMAKNGADSLEIFAAMMTALNRDTTESIIEDLFKDKKFALGLQTFIETAIKKQASSSLPQVEGLMATYMLLVQTVATNPKSLNAQLEKAITNRCSSQEKTTFLFSTAMTSATASNTLVAQTMPRVISLCTTYSAKADAKIKNEKETAKSAIVKAMASCIAHPVGGDSCDANATVESALKPFLDYRPTGDKLIQALFVCVNQLSVDHRILADDQNATRQARENDRERLAVKGQGIAGAHGGMDVNAVRRAAKKMMSKCQSDEALAMSLILMHAGSSLKGNTKQREALIRHTKEALTEYLQQKSGDAVDVVGTVLVDTIMECAMSAQSQLCGGGPTSDMIHTSAVNLTKSLGIISSNFLLEDDDDDNADDDGNDKGADTNKKSTEEVKNCVNHCVNELPKRYGQNLKKLLTSVESMTEENAGVFRSPKGTLYEKGDEDNKSKDGSNSDKSRGGKSRMTEDEAWEMQMRKEIASKKKGGANDKPKELTKEQKKLITEQDAERDRLSILINTELKRAVFAIEQLALCDIEVGNSCISVVGPGILKLATSTCAACSTIPAIRHQCLDTLTVLASCVYEIQEEYAPMLAAALVASCNVEAGNQESTTDYYSSSDILAKALPSPCEAAATTIFEMDEFMEELSASSFAFLFPVVRAALMGPRTTPGCEGALRVLERHTVYMTSDILSPLILALRREMAVTVLELLRHDRAQTFVDPTPIDTLVQCYGVPEEVDDEAATKLSTAEVAPLLDERGALGPRNCRLASMKVLRSIAATNLKMVKSNPLVESRIWLNCYDDNTAVKLAARHTWCFVHGADNVDEDSEDIADSLLPPPSQLYAIPLLALLNHQEDSVAKAAAKAFASGMAAHPASVQRNLQKVCTTYIDSFPAPSDGKASKDPFPSALLPSKAAKAPVAAAPKKKKTMGVPSSLKKKTVKKSALQVASIGQPKKSGKKNKAVSSALLKPKKERTLDTTDLVSQFKPATAQAMAEKDTPEKISVRRGVLRAILELTSMKVTIDIPTLTLLTSFLVAYGIADGEKDIKGSSRNALSSTVASFGSSDEAIEVLLPTFDKVLKTGAADNSTLEPLAANKVPSDADACNSRKEGAVVALGSVALHLKGPDNASKIDTTIDMLMDSLKTPNEDVQSSVANCLSKLMKKGNTKARIEQLLETLLETCLAGDSSPARRGAAYGLAAAVQGSGIATLKKFGIVDQLEEACSDGEASAKEGSLFAIELLCLRLGLLFEPYVKILLPSLLRSFSDTSDHVRKAASNTAGIIMSKLSAHGVKIVMPSVLTAFNDSSWRTKQASIAMLGSMSHLAPKQLASALPKVVPKLTEAFGDTHPKVKSSAQEALDEISTVIKNPEISSVSRILLKALTDPAESTVTALEALIETEFLHAIDAPSLALIVPIIHRGLRDRGATTKRYGALIAGNICTMINDPRDFVPYLSMLMPDLKAILLDPIPDVRSISAKALGSLIRGLGEETIPDLRPWLMDRLRAEDASSAERSGAAQGLTETLIASGNTAVESVMLDDILTLRSHPQASTREGVLWVLTFMPPALGQGFTVLLDDSLPALIGGLSDDNEQVREVAMRAGRVLIKSHGRVHVNKILPILENGMGDDDYRIRLSSLLLIGDLLSMIGGTTVITSDGDTQDDARRAEKAQAQITLSLGITTRNRVLSRLYLARSDAISSVRHSAIQVWKTIVSVTARILRQILPQLVTRVVTELASGHPERTEMAGKCLGDIVSKLGDSVLPEIIPVLRNALYDGDHHTRCGVCVGLSEVLKSSTRDQILRFIDIVVKVVQDALCDDEESVRDMAAASFQSLHSLVGSRAMDEVVPALMVALESERSDEKQRVRALNGITGILSIRSRELLPYIIPKLIQVPVTINHAKALGGIAAVTDDSLYFHFSSIIPAIMNDLSHSDEKSEPERVGALRECVATILESTDAAGINWLVGDIANKCSSDKPEMRTESCWMFKALIIARKDKKDFYDQIPIIIRELVYRFNDEDTASLKSAHGAFVALSKNVAAEELVKNIEFMRNLIASLVSDARRRKGGVGDGEFLLPGFNMPKGLEPLLPIYQRGILYGSPVIREASACGLGEVISLTAPKFLAGPLIIKMTGPLLRIVGDRNPAKVKVAILQTLGLILVKGGPALRAFVPQFQTTFVKALSDPSRQVRTEAISALGLLMPLAARVDPLIKELIGGALGKTNATTETAGIIAVQTATSEALSIVLTKGGKKVKLKDSVPSALSVGCELIDHSDEGLRESGAKVVGAACGLLDAENAAVTIRDTLLESSNDSSDSRHGKACATRRVLSSPVGSTLDQSLLDEMLDFALSCMKDDKRSVKEAGCVAFGAAIGQCKDPAGALKQNESSFMSVMENSQEPMEVHQAIAKGLALCLTLSMDTVQDRISFFGLKLINACLKLALHTSQRVQFAFNDVLYLLLDVENGQAGLDAYCSKAMFDTTKQMKSLYTKVLLKIKEVTILDD